MSIVKNLAIVVVLALIAGAIFIVFMPHPAVGTPKENAINAVIQLHPELAAYKTTSLPPSFIETKQVGDTWYVGFIQRGSGIPGILHAECYYVDSDGAVAATGQYSRQDNIESDTVALEDCTPNNVPTPQVNVTPYGNVSLRLNQLAIFKDISIRPVAIEEDSRCPVDVQCIQAGTVRVRVEISAGAGTSTSIVKLGQVFTTEGVAVTFTSADPAKNSKVTITNGDYVFTFNVVPQGAPVSTNPAGKCYIGGCSAQLCTDAPDAVSTCEYRAQYACYKKAACKRQGNGECGWTPTPELTACLSNS